jgi:peptidoglycan/LPS O-acetylase OafA/YrhL
MNDATRNNFDLIRLFAASQVAILHIAFHLGVESSILRVVSLFPGVPIFFFVSGYLIYGSYEQSNKNPNTNLNFFAKRFLRLFPALWLCFVLSIVSIWASGYLSEVDFSISDFAIWVITQNTIFQFYNPDFMRGYGVGVINGSLWTISVELQFYILTPFLFLLLNKLRSHYVILVLLFLVVANVSNTHLNEGLNVYQKLLNVSFAPWLYMFMLGSLAYKYSSLESVVKRINFIIFLVLFVVSHFVTKDYTWGNDINPISYLLLAALVLKAAYTKPSLSDSLLKKNDISYGIYIFHMPIVNYLMYQGMMGVNGLVLAVIATLVVSILSWFYYEKRILALKKSALRKN